MVPMFSHRAPMNLVWRPLFRQMDEMLEAMNTQAERSSQRFELHETEDLYVLNFDIPGVQREDLSIELVGSRLQIHGERKSEINGNLRVSSFRQHIDLPEGVQPEQIAAEQKDGVLRVAIQKPATVKPTKIKVGDGTTKGFLKNLLGTDKKIEVKKEATEKTEVAAY